MKKKSIHTEQKAVKSKTDSLQPAEIRVPIIGVGASAGGLEAIEAFLGNIPADCGMAFVIVQHLDPVHKGFLVELLQRVTPMPVVQVIDRMPIKPGHVYVIPPNRDMSMLRGFLHLVDPVEPHGLRLPVDTFFRSMADDLQQYSIGVILSGMGSDGTLGLRAIKEKGGGVFVQDPATAKFDGMPRSAIDAGLADIVAAPDELILRITSYIAHQSMGFRPRLQLEEKMLSGLEKVLIILRAQTRQDFSLYKKSTIYRRIERRMGIHQIESIAAYVRFLQENPQETELLFKELLIGVTNFFRDPDAWAVLKEKAIPVLIAAKPSGGTIRAWVAGCSTGEEAFSLAIVFLEVLTSAELHGRYQVQIFATDLDKDAIDKARIGLYPPNIVADVSSERLNRFFVRDDHGWRVSREVREMVVFAPQNVIMDPPFTRIDILVCRNLMIYWEQELQKKLLPLFHYSLNSSGILFLGSAETIGLFNFLFEPVSGKIRIYRKIDQCQRAEGLEFPSSFTTSAMSLPGYVTEKENAGPSALNLKSFTDQVLLQNYTPSAVLTNAKGDIIYISGRTGKYLEPAAGKANWNIFAMVREGLRHDLEQLFGMSMTSNEPVARKGIHSRIDGESLMVNLTVQRLESPDSMKNLVLVVFSTPDMPEVVNVVEQGLNKEKRKGRVDVLELEIKHARDEILTIREEMQSSQEELKSANEELQSANEELQSTNEELTTSKEEMQSLNEELQTVNHELQSKVTELSQANNDMKNLLNSTDIATLFLDESLNIRRFTTRTATIIKLIASDVGRPVTDIVTDLDYPLLADDAREVLQTLVFREKQVTATDGRWFNVRIMPYRTQENRIDGLVITFSDISAGKRLELNLLKADRRFVSAIDSAGMIVATIDRELRCTWACDPHHLLVPKGAHAGEIAPVSFPVEMTGIMRTVLETGHALQKEQEIKLSDGIRRSYLFRVIPLPDVSDDKSSLLVVLLPKEN
ncbi:MAG: chemotaxis protein CheB [Chlorobiaceae bacterium]|nr:chemotaxis protein CheB [Chlorobiaceae bacterium]